jgi:hypothetical protein
MAIIGVKAMTVMFIEENTDKGFDFDTGDPEPTVLAALPRMLYTAPAKLAIVAAVIALCVGIVHGVFVVIDWKDGKRVRHTPGRLAANARLSSRSTIPEHSAKQQNQPTLVLLLTQIA